MSIAVETSQYIGRAIADVFEALVDPEAMSGYFISGGSARMEAGTTVRWHWDDHAEAALDIDVLAVELDQKLAFRWAPGGVASNVTIELSEEAGKGTKVSVRDGSWDADAEGIARYGEQMQGWVHMLVCLKAYLEYAQVNLRTTPTQPYELQVERLMKASPAALYRAWTREWDSWFGVPKSSRNMQGEVGAPFCFDGVTEDGKHHPHYGRFVELKEDRLVVMTWVNEATHGVETRVTVDLLPRDSGTLLRLSHGGFHDEAGRNGYRKNWPAVLEHLDKCIAR